MKTLFIFIVLFALVGFVLWLYFKYFKVPKMNALVMVTGGVKAGKSTFAIACGIQQHKQRVFRTKIVNWFRRLFHKEELPLPRFYSNIPVNYPYVELTEDLLFRRKRFVYGSVIYCGECSLVANSMNFNKLDDNERILLFNKLIGHELRGGLIIYDTQCIGDTHFGIRRSLSQQFFVHHTNKCLFLPFIIVYTRELVYTEDNGVQNNFNEDVEESLKRTVIWKSIWNKFDAYCYSILTDDLPVEERVIDEKKDDLRCDKILSFNKYKTLYNAVFTLQQENMKGDKNG